MTQGGSKTPFSAKKAMTQPPLNKVWYPITVKRKKNLISQSFKKRKKKFHVLIPKTEELMIYAFAKLDSIQITPLLFELNYLGSLNSVWILNILTKPSKYVPNVFKNFSEYFCHISWACWGNKSGCRMFVTLYRNC